MLHTAVHVFIPESLLLLNLSYSDEYKMTYLYENSKLWQERGNLDERDDPCKILRMFIQKT